MDEITGWLFDLYEHHERGLVIWIIAEDGSRLCLRMEFPITFYVAGDFKMLRAAWIFLRGKAQLARTRKRDLYLGERDVMSVTVMQHSNLLHELQNQFPMLDYYDADIPPTLRFISHAGVHLLGRCRVVMDGTWIQSIQQLDTPWQITSEVIPLRVLELSPNVDPAFSQPTRLRVRNVRGEYWVGMEPIRPFLISLQSDLLRFDPDLILTTYGDAWLLPLIEKLCQETGLRVDLNRDTSRTIQTHSANSYFAYGQVIYRGAQSHLFGRWHIDRRNALLFDECGLEGLLELSRVTGIGVQEMARKSPGAGITAMQMQTALRTGVMVPLHKQQAEGSKTLAGLIRADRGGLIYQPIIGVHRDVAQIDFASMYPSIMVHYNISPETMGKDGVPDGLLPQTLKPLLEKRLRLKQLANELDARDCELASLKYRAVALKWLLVVCFGYLGYKNARFGKIESHEAVTALSRELMLQSKEIAEEMGFTVLHMYVDSLFVQKERAKDRKDFEPLLKAIAEQTHIAIALDGIYRWVAFPPSRQDVRVPVPNRYFGTMQDGSVKYRGIEARRRDTPFWVKKMQLKILNCLAKAGTLDDVPGYLAAVHVLIGQAKRDLRNGKVPIEELVITQSLSREVEEYRASSSAARSAMQLSAIGRKVAPGQFMRFVYIRGQERVRAWELGVDARTVDIERYCILLDRAVMSVVGVFGEPSTRLL